jgi:putative transposase
LDPVDRRRVLAQVEVTFSNSVIEAFWRSLKYSWIYLHSLDTAAAVRRLVEFYVTAHNEVTPHSAFEGQTPNEMYFGTGGAVAIDLASAGQAAREERMKAKRAARCGVWIGKGDQGRCSCNGHAPGCHETQLG